MKISIIGGGNMGGAIALGLAACTDVMVEDITVIHRRQAMADELSQKNPVLHSVTGDYSSLPQADVVIVAVKPWMVEDVLRKNIDSLKSKNQILVSVASGVSLDELEEWTALSKPVFQVMPNTAISIRQSMTFVAQKNASEEQQQRVTAIFSKLGEVEVITERLMPAAMSLASCGIAYAFRYVRAAMEGGVEMGLYPNQAKDIVIQTLRGAIELLESGGLHPEQEIDKVTTAGGVTIKGLNEMEHAGFTSAVIRGLKASCANK